MTVSQNITIKDVFHQPLLLWDPTWNHTEVKSRTSETTTYVSIPMLLWYMVCSLLNWSSYLFTHSLVNEIGKLWPFVEWTGPTIFLIGAQLYRVNFLEKNDLKRSSVQLEVDHRQCVLQTPSENWRKDDPGPMESNASKYPTFNF